MDEKYKHDVVNYLPMRLSPTCDLLQLRAELAEVGAGRSPGRRQRWFRARFQRTSARIRPEFWDSMEVRLSS